MKTAGKLTSITGAGAAALLLSYVPQFEGMVLRGYKDPIGIVTACAGHTATAVLGRAYTLEQCTEILDKDLVVHAVGVLKCTPGLKGMPYQLASAVSFAFNIGVSAYCNSTTAKRFNKKDYLGACRAMNESDSGKPQWVTAAGKTLPGLVKRRKVERAMCEGNVK